ncbi:hypothetical protein EIP86_003689 [Pleurotus ostreatoroseus]|nr:hypothetical protein EIP86_003689 [Pleurotus ostreatoroseus]
MSYNHREYLNDDAFDDSEHTLEDLPYPESPLAANTRLSPESDPGSPLPERFAMHPSSYALGDSATADSRNEQLESFSPSPSRSESPPYDSPLDYEYDLPYIPPDVPQYSESPMGGISPSAIYRVSDDDEYCDLPPEPVKHNLRPRRAITRIPPPESDDESEDSGSEYSDDEPNSEDDEVLPASSSKRTRAQKHARLTRTRSRSSSPPSRPPSLLRRSSQRHHPYLPKDENPVLARIEQFEENDRRTADGFQCPHCPHYQQNRRRPDLRRHIAAHFQKMNQRINGPKWLCCGVPVSKAKGYGVTDVSSAKPLEFAGNLRMVGGCFKTFSRKDAYHRHLRQSGCPGDAHGDWMPSNKGRQC